MKTVAKPIKLKLTYAAVMSVLLAASLEAGAETVVNLCVGEMPMTMPDTTNVTMWGYGTDTGGACTPTVPGPRITLPAGETLLTVNLRNTLPAGSADVSIMIPGLASATPSAPVLANTDGTSYPNGAPRMRAISMVPVTAPGATGVYQFNTTNKTGTRMYQSGTHPAVQVQMGLYGMATQDAATGAYDGVPYDNEVVLVYSEVDPALHAAVAGGTYGTPTYPSTINYQPKYFLVNGASSTTPIAAGTAGQKTLIRFMNAGLESHAPMLQGLNMDIVAESGNAYPYARTQYSMLLAAGQTRDAIIEPGIAGDHPISDRRLRVGLESVLSVGAAVPAGSAPVAVADAATTDEDTAVIIDVAGNDTDADLNLNASSVAIVTQGLNGTASGNGDGTVTYTPNANFNGGDSFTYNIRDDANNVSNTATVTVTVNAINDDPVAADDGYSATQDTALNIAAAGVLGNDSDVDGDALNAVLVAGPANGGLVLNADGSFTYTPNAGFTGSDSFSYMANDGVANSNVATVTIVVDAPVNAAPVAVDDSASVTQNIGTPTNSVIINVIANDTDDGTIVPGSVVVTTQPRKGTATPNGDGTVTYTPTPGKRGSDAFGYTVQDDQGATSNQATVRINILK